MRRSSEGNPILSFAVTAAECAENERLRKALVEIAARNSSVRVQAEPQQNTHTIEGMTESELDAICDLLREEYGMAIQVGPPTAILLETVRTSAEAEGKYIRQIGGLGNYGHCRLRIQPNNRGEGYKFTSLVGDVLRDEDVNSIDRGVQHAMEAGVLSGHQLVDLQVFLIDGSYHPEDSNARAFEIAGSIAFQAAAKKALPVVLEPMMAIEIDQFPEELTESIAREIKKHRGRVANCETSNGWVEMKAVVPLAAILESQSSLLAEFSPRFIGYEPLFEDGSSDDGWPGVTAKKPNLPRSGRSFEKARAGLEDE